MVDAVVSSVFSARFFCSLVADVFSVVGAVISSVFSAFGYFRSGCRSGFICG